MMELPYIIILCLMNNKDFDKTFWIVYVQLKKKYPLWSAKKLIYITHKLMKK